MFSEPNTPFGIDDPGLVRCARVREDATTICRSHNGPRRREWTWLASEDSPQPPSPPPPIDGKVRSTLHASEIPLPRVGVGNLVLALPSTFLFFPKLSVPNQFGNNFCNNFAEADHKRLRAAQRSTAAVGSQRASLQVLGPSHYGRSLRLGWPGLLECWVTHAGREGPREK